MEYLTFDHQHEQGQRDQRGNDGGSHAGPSRPVAGTSPAKGMRRAIGVLQRDTTAAAAPTAGLHFTPRLLEELQLKGVKIAFVTLHVGLDTFAPVNEDDPQAHKIHTEWCDLPLQTADAINETRERGGRVIAVGTTSVRTLETIANIAQGAVPPYVGSTSLFILPGYQYKVEPYAGLGIGLNMGNISDGNFRPEAAFAPSFNVLAGVKYYFTPKIAPFIEYKYNFAHFTFDRSNVTADYRANLFMFGVAYHFGR